MVGLFCFTVYAYVCFACMSGACDGQKRALDIVKLELQVFVNHCVYAGNETQVLGKSTSTLTAKPSAQLFVLF